MATERPPLVERIGDVKIQIECARVLRDSYRRDSYDGGREWTRQMNRIDGLLDQLYALILERLVEEGR